MTDLQPAELCLVVDSDHCQTWMGPDLDEQVEPGRFAPELLGNFVCRWTDGEQQEFRTLDPFICYLPDAQQDRRLHCYDSIYRYTAKRKEVAVLEYEFGFKQTDQSLAADREAAFTAELLTQAFQRHRTRMEVIEGRVASFAELLAAHADIVGRQFAIDHVTSFLSSRDRGMLLIEAEPGKGKTALIAHLIEEVFGLHSPPPVHFLYRRTAGLTDPDVCVKSIYHGLLDAHNLTEAVESRQQDSPEETYNKLTRLLEEQIAPRLSPGRPQLIFIDALDESEPTSRGRTAFDRIPENLLPGVFVVATTRHVSDRTRLAGRTHVEWFDLDAADLAEENLKDGMEYVDRELAGTALPRETVNAIARIGAGNFLVLKLLCSHLRTTIAADQVDDYLHSLTARPRSGAQLGFIYHEYWDRITARSQPAEIDLFCNVAGALVMSFAALTQNMVCRVLGISVGQWDFALRHLAEYLSVIDQDEDGAQETFFRVYHQSFSDFLRTRIDTEQITSRLADYCLRWSELPPGYERNYALKYGPQHLLDARRWNDLE